MDCQMPVMDGFTATARIREMEREAGLGKRLPIIALTANVMTEDREHCIAAGMDAHIGKPIVPTQLVDCLEPLPRRQEGAARCRRQRAARAHRRRCRVRARAHRDLRLERRQMPEGDPRGGPRQRFRDRGQTRPRLEGGERQHPRASPRRRRLEPGARRAQQSAA